MIRNSERKKVIHCNLMSIFLAAAYNPKAAVIFHAPKSCSHIAYNAFWEMRLKIEQKNFLDNRNNSGNLFVTGLGDKEAIFGGEKILKDCLLEVAAACRPEYMIVAAGCAAGVIGDDVESVCKEAEKETGITAFYVEGSGFMNQKTVDGVLTLTKVLCRRLVYPLAQCTKDKASIAVFGMNLAFSRLREINELNRLLGLFGFTSVYYPPCGMGLQDFKKMAAVSAVTAVNFLPHNLAATQKFAEAFAATMQIDCIYMKLPSTMEGVYRYLMAAGETLCREADALNIIQNEKRAYEKILEQTKQSVQGRTYLLAVSLPQRYFDLPPLLEILQLVGLQLQGIVFCEELTKQEQQSHIKILNEQITTRYYTETELIALTADILITTAPKKCSLKQYCIGFRRIGRSGIENFLQKLVTAINEQRSLIYENR